MGGKEMKGVRHTGQSCKCGQELNSWDLRCSKSLARKPNVCEQCLAAEYSITVNEFRDKLEGFFGMRPCQGI